MRLIATTNTIEIVPVNDIICIEACHNYSKFYMNHKKLILSKDSLGKIEQDTEDSFFRIHHSHIINVHNVLRYHRNGEVEMINGKKLPVARRRRSEFVNTLKSVINS